MIIAFWIVAGLTALAFLAAGLMKLVRPTDALAATGLTWVEDYRTGPVKLIGVAEVLGAVGLVLPPLLGVAVVLTPVAGIALAILMVGAIITHARRKENPVPPLVLGILSLAAAVLGILALV